jgi:hypothetical protein
MKYILELRAWLIRLLAGKSTVAINFELIEGGLRTQGEYGVVANVFVTGARGFSFITHCTAITVDGPIPGIKVVG